MPGGSKDGYDAIRHIVEKVAAQVDDGPCVTYIGPGGAGACSASLTFAFLTFIDLHWKCTMCKSDRQTCRERRGKPFNASKHPASVISLVTDSELILLVGNFVKQVHNGIEYGDMQLISEVSSSI